MTPDTIRRLRESLGESRAQFARRLTVDQFTVQRWEEGLRRPLPATEKRLLALVKRHKVAGQREE